MSSFEIDYREDLVRRIRDLIDGYDKDSVLKEYLQNADDAGATEFIVTFDRQQYPHLCNTKYESASGVALLLYNNSRFKKGDFENIVNISTQGKTDDANSTGRFGQGFSCSFSISDHPSFISNGRAYWFDILKTSVSKNEHKSIQAWEKEGFPDIEDWLQTFNVDIINKNFDGTIFRLPLRNDMSASKSKISSEIFSFNDFLKWVDQWGNSAENLLFLRHVNRFVLQEIDENGDKIVHLEIKTKNMEKIEYIKNKIQGEFKGNLLKTCENWLKNGAELPIFKYTHKFTIKYLDRVKKQCISKNKSWSIVNGLFRGENDSLIKQAIEVLKITPNPRKVLPWAGVAIEIDGNNVPIKQDSNFFTFLPLPIKSKHPVHIHGWFDLNPKRTEITASGSGDDKEKLRVWNCMLFEQAVGNAWSMLVDTVKELCNSKQYYPLWPKYNDNEFDECMVEGFYSQITKLECLNVQYKHKKKWCKPTDNIFVFEDNTDTNLFSALQENFSIITPSPTPYVIKNLADLGVGLKDITPKSIREYILKESDSIDFPVPAREIPITMLSQKKWLLAILEYCADADDDKDFTYLENMPFALTLRDEICRIERDSLLDKDPKLALFKNDKSLFIDFDIVDLLEYAKVLPTPWLKPTLKSYLLVLNQTIEHYEYTKEWLQYLVDLICSHSDKSVNEAIEEIFLLKIVYQSNKEYGYLKAELATPVNLGSPVFVNKDGIDDIVYLEKIGMKLVHPDYTDIFRPLLKYDKLITELTSKNLIKYLVQVPVHEYVFFENKNIRNYLVDLLSQDISCFDEISDEEKEWMKDIPFIATETNNIYALSGPKKLYLPAGFKPPKDIPDLKGEYEIVSAYGKKQVRLFKKIGLKEQSSDNYIREIIIPYIETAGVEKSDHIVDILKWLANEWDELTIKIEEKENNQLIDELSRAAIVPDESRNKLDYSDSYYCPSTFEKLPDFLQNSGFKPISFEDVSTQDKWNKLLTVLGAKQNIIPKHIVFTIKKFVAHGNHKGATDLLNYISNNFEIFESMECDGRGIFEILSPLPWIPTEEPADDFLAPEMEYRFLQKPSDVILQSDYKIVGGVYYSLCAKVNLGKKGATGEYKEKDIAEKIGLLVHLSDEAIFASFRRLRSISINNDQTRKKVLNFAKAFYRYLGRTNKTAIPSNILERSIFIRGQWLSSEKVFQTKVNLFGIFCWDEIVETGNFNLEEGLRNLGVHHAPDTEYLIEFLENLPKHETLKGHQLNDTKSILTLLSTIELDNLEKIYEIPLLSQDNKLFLSEELYINDLPAYRKSNDKNEDLSFSQVQFQKLSKYLGVTSIADNIKPFRDKDLCVFMNSDELDEDKRLDQYISTDSFKSAVLRFSIHEAKVTDDDIDQCSLDGIFPSNIQFLKKLVINYRLDDGTWIYTDSHASAYEDKNDNVLYLLDQEDSEDICDSITKYICNRSDLSTDSFALLNRIVRNKLNNNDIHDLLDRKNIKELPKQINIEISNSIFDETYLKSIENEDKYAKLEGENSHEMGHGNSGVDVNADVDLDVGATAGREVSSQTKRVVLDTKNSERLSNNDSEQHGKVPKKEGQPGVCNLKEKSHNDIDASTDDSLGKEVLPPTQPKMPGTKSNDKLISKNVDQHIQGQGRQYHGNASRPILDNKAINGGFKSQQNTDFNPKIISSNDRKPVYVSKEKEVDTDISNKLSAQAQEIGNRGEEYILSNHTKYISSEINTLLRAPVNNEGFDIVELNQNKEVVRYIEVKALSGEWGDGGVSVTCSQFEFARREQDKWWLFVVENINSENTKVFMFKNPVIEANRFMFDKSWKQLAHEPNVELKNEPMVGDRYLIKVNDKEVIAQVKKVKQRGKLSSVELITENGENINKKFDWSWRKL